MSPAARAGICTDVPNRHDTHGTHHEQSKPPALALLGRSRRRCGPVPAQMWAKSLSGLSRARVAPLRTAVQNFRPPLSMIGERYRWAARAEREPYGAPHRPRRSIQHDTWFTTYVDRRAATQHGHVAPPAEDEPQLCGDHIEGCPANHHGLSTRGTPHRLSTTPGGAARARLSPDRCRRWATTVQMNPRCAAR
jgi:hypothetical protein